MRREKCGGARWKSNVTCSNKEFFLIQFLCDILAKCQIVGNCAITSGYTLHKVVPVSYAIQKIRNFKSSLSIALFVLKHETSDSKIKSSKVIVFLAKVQWWMWNICMEKWYMVLLLFSFFSFSFVKSFETSFLHNNMRWMRCEQNYSICSSLNAWWHFWKIFSVEILFCLF